MYDDLVKRQRDLNLGTALAWDSYREHRARLTKLIMGHHHPAVGARLVILGAGNCNDVDLRQVGAAYGEVCLVDIDEDALKAAVERQGLSRAPHVRLFGAINLADVEPQTVAKLGHADVVVSAGLLTQLLDAEIERGGAAEELVEVRNAHLRLLARLLSEKGVALLVTDFVSSDTCPALHTVADADLPMLAADLIEAKNFFTGANPFAVEQRLRNDPHLSVRPVGVTLPWRWTLGARVYLVCAVVFEKLAGR
ncbi:hypothetical protein [Micromonospora sp. IBHARD004]|uniref:hypothetical protein n=1 Tax=Micromonospora sp. IBHARD004 TaxID=3457764 RepID=UPI004058AFBE